MTNLVKTEVGYIERQSLDDLRDDFDTLSLLGCIEVVEKLRGEITRLHRELTGLHSMACRAIWNDKMYPLSGSGDDIHQQAEIVDSAAFELIEAGEKIQREIAPLQDLLTDAVLAKMEEDGQ